MEYIRLLRQQCAVKVFDKYDPWALSFCICNMIDLVYCVAAPLRSSVCLQTHTWKMEYLISVCESCIMNEVTSNISALCGAAEIHLFTSFFPYYVVLNLNKARHKDASIRADF